MRDKIRWIWNVWKPIRAWFWLLVVLTVISTSVAMAYPLVLKSLLDSLQQIVAGGDRSEASSRLWGAVFALMAIGFGRFLANFYPAARGYLNSRIERQVREAVFERILRKGPRFFLKFRTGDLVTRLTDDINDYPRVAWFCCSGIFRAVESGSKFIFCVAVMLWLDWRLALMGIAPLPIMILMFILVHRALGKRVELHRSTVSETYDLLEASFSGIRIVKAYNAEGRQAEALTRQLERRIGVEMSLVRLQQLIQSLQTAFNVLGQIVVVGAGGIMVIRGDITAGTFYAFYAYLGMLALPLMDVPNLLVAGRQAFVSIDRVEELQQTGIDEEGGAFRGTDRLARFQGLQLKDVRFDYGSAGPDAISGLNLELRRGESLAIVGEIGSGKTTLVRLAAGSLVPTAGEVLLNGRPLASYNAESSSRLVGLVPQEPVLLRGSIRDNVVFGRPVDPARLEAVLAAVGLTDEIAGLPAGLDQEVGQRGQSLSGGQRQRLTIARALYGRPELLLLDDLTSALDARNEERLWRSLQTLVPDAALLVVTHRIATARSMNRIAVLEGGRIAAVGTHDELLLSSSLYREFQHGWTSGASSLVSA